MGELQVAVKQYSNIVWYGGHISRAEREALLRQRSRTLWLRRLSASGKSTLAFALECALITRGRACHVRDGDNVRRGLNGNLGISTADWSENIRRVAEVVKLKNDAGLIVISAYASLFRANREHA